MSKDVWNKKEEIGSYVFYNDNENYIHIVITMYSSCFRKKYHNTHYGAKSLVIIAYETVKIQ